MAATSIPQLIAYAETVGYAGYRGIATAGPPLITWGIVTGSPFMNAGVTSITALMAKADLGGEEFVSKHGEEEYVYLVAAYSMYVGLASILLALVGFGKLAKSVPLSVRRGFKWGCAVGVLVAAIPNGLFHSGSKEMKSLIVNSDLMVENVVVPLKSLPGTVGVSSVLFALFQPWLWGAEAACMFTVGTYFVMKGKSILPSSLPPGSEVIFFIALATVYSVKSSYSGAIVGDIPEMDADAGISFFGGYLRIPIELIDINRLLSVDLKERFGSTLMLTVSVMAFSAVNFLSIMGIASGFESDNGIAWSAERELISQGVSCGVAACVGSAPVSGSMSRSLVARMTGATSQLACIVTGLAWIYLQPYMAVMSPTPKAALSAVIASAVVKGVCIPKDLLQLTGVESIVGWGTGLLTALTSPTQGFVLGLALYTMSLLVSSSKRIKQD